MKKGDLIRLFNGLHTVKDLPGVRFAYVVTKNKKKIIEEVEALSKAGTPPKEIMEHTQKTQELAEEYARKDKNGQATKQQLNGNAVGYVIDDTKALQKAMDKLNKEYKKPLADWEKKVEEYNALLKEPLDNKITFEKISIDQVPEEITPAQLEAIDEIIE